MMRTTLTIDDDVLLAAKSLARNRSVSIGKVLSELARKGLKKKSTLVQKNGIPVFNTSESSKPITMEQVKQDEDDL